MALPVTELYALFLERRPEEKERVEQARLLDAKVGKETMRKNKNREGNGELERLKAELTDIWQQSATLCGKL